MSAAIHSPQAAQDAFADAIRRFMAERTVELETALFDLPNKIVLGQYAGVEVLPGMIAELERRMPGEELGRRRRVIGLPLALGLCGTLWIYLFGRLQKYIDAGWPEQEVDLGDDEEAARVIRYWTDMALAYRGDGSLVAEGAADKAVIRCLDGPDIDRLVEGAMERGTPDDVEPLRRTSAQLQMYLFLIHGEQRDGIFNHGPYELGDGRVLVVKEYTDLRNRFMPWVTDDFRLETSKVVIPLVLEGVRARFDMYGTLYTEPEDFYPHVEGFDILAGDELQRISERDLAGVGAHSQEVQRGLFRLMAGWDERYKLTHAASQYANVNTSLLEVAGCTDEEIRSILVDPFEAEADRAYDLVKKGSGVWKHVASGKDPLFVEVKA